jgi:hypothetical protein
LDEEIDETSDIRKKNSMIIKLHKIAYAELILLIGFKASSSKFALNIIRGYKNKDYPDGNDSMAWKKLKNK